MAKPQKRNSPTQNKPRPSIWNTGLLGFRVVAQVLYSSIGAKCYVSV